MNSDRFDWKIVVTGAAGLVGQNLVAMLSRMGYRNLTAIDKHEKNMAILARLHPDVACVTADLAEPGTWEKVFSETQRLFLLQAQITGAEYAIFQRNTIDSTANVLRAAKEHRIPFTVFASSSVVNSVADDNYTRSKIEQEKMMLASGLDCCLLRPTLMFGWFDPKHFGWLSRFMARMPVFPIPGHGRYVRQPLYVQDFCRALVWCAENRPSGAVYDIVGQEDVCYIDIIKTIKAIKKLRTTVVPIPVPLFRFLLKFYALFSSRPPFVADQLDALMAGDYFKGHDLETEFGFRQTPFQDAMIETFTDPVYSGVVLER